MKRVKLIGLVLVLALATACSKDDDNHPEPAKADIFGFVSLYDEGTNKLDDASMAVYIDGKKDMYSATTNSDGRFSIKDIELGTYTVVFAKNGYGTYKIYDVKVESDEGHVSLNTPSLGQLSTTEVTSLIANIDGSDVVLTYETSPAGNSNSPKYIRYFFNDDSNVSSDVYKHYTEVYEIKSNPHEREFSKNDLIDMGFKSGDKVYVKVYGDSFWSNEYDDPDLSRKVFPNLNANSASEVSFVVP